MNEALGEKSDLKPREAARHNRFLDVKIRRGKGSRGEFADAIAVDVSLNGAGLLTYKNYNIGDEIFIEVDGKLMAIGKVVNCKAQSEASDSPLLRLGVKIVEPRFNWIPI